LALGGGLTDPRIDALAGRRGADPVPFWSLMSNRVRRVLLVCSLYDSYALEEDGSFTELLGDRSVKLLGWYDNEWGYAARCVDLLQLLAHSGSGGGSTPGAVS